jgi:dipeptidyl-peptidase-4
MRIPPLLILLVMLATPFAQGTPSGLIQPASAQGGPAPPLTVESILDSPSVFGTSPSQPTWSPDSRHLAFLWSDAGRPQREIWVTDAGGGAPRRLTQVTQQGAAPQGIREIAWTADAASLAFLHGGDVWRIAVTGGSPERLTTDGGGKTALAVSPDGRYLSFLKDGDLWLYHAGGKQLVRATRVGVPPVGTVPLGTYFAPDVEIGQDVWGGGPPYLWSPDSRHIAVQHVDRRHLRTVPFPYYLGDETTVNQLRRSYPGDDNEARTLGFYGVTTGELRLIDLPGTRSTRIVDYEWSPSGTLLIDREADTATERWLVLANPTTDAVRPIWHDERASRVYTAITSRWHPDGEQVLMIGDLDDRYRLYALRPGQAKPVALTGPGYDVTGDRGVVAPQVHGATAAIFYVSNEVNPYERHVYRLSGRDPAPVRLTMQAGTHVPFLSPDGQRLALLSSDDVTPTELYVTDAKRPGAATRVTSSPLAGFGALRFVRPRYVTFKSRIDDYTLHARIFEPADLDRSRKYPVLLGPVYSNTVRNRWAGLYGAVQQLLVQRGYVVAQVDLRGSTGYGRAFREEFLMDWGGEDLDDLQSTVEYLSKLPYADTGRAGIWGSSYGGTLSVFALFKKPGLFKAGVAGAPAVDPRFFGSDDVAISRRPQSHPEAFTRGRASEYAKNLRDHLLIIHGMQDDVVPFKTTVDLAEHLMRLGKDFEVAFAPGATHGWTQQQHHARYLLKRLVAHFDRYLLTGDEPSARQNIP